MHRGPMAETPACAGRAEPPAGLPDLRFSTASLPAPQQFEAWRDRLSAWMEVLPTQDRAGGFRAEHRTWQLGPIAVTWSSGEGLINRRDLARARRDQLDHWVIVLMRHGEFLYHSDSGSLVVDRRNLVLYGMQMPNLSERSEAEWIMAFVARDALPDIAPSFDALLGRTLDTAMGGLLRGYLDGLTEQLPRMSQAEAPRAAEATLAMIRATVTGSADHCEAARPQVQAAIRSRVMGLIRANLGSARLDPVRLARMAGMSRSQLYRAFEPEGGVARAIQRERLRAIRRALADPAERRGIARIAEELGMPDASSFSRIFRQDFGMSPREFREHALAVGGTAPPVPAPPGEARHIGEVFRHLRG